MNHGEIVSFLWGVADLIRDTFKRGKYQDVILPLTVLRRLDCVLAGYQSLAAICRDADGNPSPIRSCAIRRASRCPPAAIPRMPMGCRPASASSSTAR